MATGYSYDKEGAGRSTASPLPGNKFANDGSFMEMFKRRMEEQMRREKGGAELAKELSRDRTLKEPLARSQPVERSVEEAVPEEARQLFRGEPPRLAGENPVTSESSPAKAYQVVKWCPFVEQSVLQRLALRVDVCLTVGSLFPM